ncbi:MAG: hypothetical protein AAFQ87_16310 [Bacteroidota bacterium]
MQNRFLVGLLFLSGVSSFLHYVGLIGMQSSVLPSSYLIFFWSGLILIMANSPLFNELRFNRFYQALIVLAGIGLLFRTLRWPYGEVMLMGSLLTAGLGYAYRFWEKPDKGLLDILKVAWVSIEICARIWRFYHLAGADWISMFAGGLFLLMLGVFLYQGLSERWLLAPSENAGPDDQDSTH